MLHAKTGICHFPLHNPTRKVSLSHRRVSVMDHGVLHREGDPMGGPP